MRSFVFILVSYLLILKVVRTQIIDLDPDCGKSVPFDPIDDLNDEKSILNAATSKEGQAGWQVLITINSEFKCGGSLISTQWILTAASCVEHNQNPSSYLINLGVYDISDNKYTIKPVQKVVIHPAYDRVDKKYDIALIKMADSVEFWKGDKNNFNIIPICVSDGTENYVDKIAIASGYASFSWGSIEPQMITTKKHIHLKVLDEEHCTKEHKENTALSINNFIQVCAMELDRNNTENREKCGLDRGGPLAVQGIDKRWHLIGITSWGFKPCTDGGVFTRISTFADYIINVLKTN